MTRDDITRMARDAGWTEYSLKHAVEVERLVRFAGLVAAAEREACAQVCRDEIASAAWTDNSYENACLDCAEAIRARGEK